MTVTPDLQPGRAMDAALGELMGKPPLWRLVRENGEEVPCGFFYTREEAERASLGGVVAEAVYPAYSTTDAGMGLVLDWLEREYLPVLEVRLDEPRYVLLLWKREGSNPRTIAVGHGFTRAEAVCRAVLALPREQADAV